MSARKHTFEPEQPEQPSQPPQPEQPAFKPAPLAEPEQPGQPPQPPQPPSSYFFEMDLLHDWSQKAVRKIYPSLMPLKRVNRAYFLLGRLNESINRIPPSLRENFSQLILRREAVAAARWYGHKISLDELLRFEMSKFLRMYQAAEGGGEETSVLGIDDPGIIEFSGREWNRMKSWRKPKPNRETWAGRHGISRMKWAENHSFDWAENRSFDKDINHKKIPAGIEIFEYYQASRKSRRFLQNQPFDERFLKGLYEHYFTADIKRKEWHWKKYGVVRTREVEGIKVPTSQFYPPELARNLLANMHQKADPLVKVSLIWYALERTPTSFTAGRRISLSLIPIMLYEMKVIPDPQFCITDYFLKHTDDYTGALQQVHQKKNWQPWVEFFLEAVIRTTLGMEKMAWQIQELYEREKEKIVSFNSRYASGLLNLLFKYPLLNSEMIPKLGQGSPQTMYDLARKFADAGIIREITGRKRYQKFSFDALIDIMESYEAEI